MKNRIITGIIVAATALSLVILGGPFFQLLIVGVSFLVGDELIRRHLRPLSFTTLLLIVLPGITYLLLVYQFFGFIFLLPLIILLLYVVDEKMSLEDLLFAVFHCAFTTLLAYTVNYLYISGHHHIIFVGLATFGCDTAAYFSGKFFGKHKLSPKISPNKTIEGAIGGWLFGSGLSLLYAHFFMNGISLVLIVSALILPIAGMFGDLAFSKMKRQLQIKDFSNLLPGHGGILDRIDSFTLTVIVYLGLMFIF